MTHTDKTRQWVIAIAALLVLALPLVYGAIIVPLSARQQAGTGLALVAFAVSASFSRPLRPLIVFLSCFASMRYFYWRVSSTLNIDSTLDIIVSVLLLSAEIYGLVILFLGYFQTIELIERAPAVPRRNPSVDIFIPTFNEPLEIVRRTVIGALAIDYPAKRVLVLDDGRRAHIETMARELGAEYLTRPDNRHAKAGNLNHALSLTDGELVAIFDADHVPVSSFLSKTLGFFSDVKVALVQTAQHFFNPDPFERNLNLVGRVAPEQHFFYHVIQPGNDLWNSAFFCGSGAVLRRSALESIGGIKTQTVTEDAHTALELHARGWKSVYLRQPLAAGLATESFAAHVKQRIRWARGMAQILRVDCPLWKRGLSFPQRLNYFNAMLHFFFGIPRLILIAAPLTFLLLGAHPIKADALAVGAYILPHIALSALANSKLSRRFRHSFWGAVYELSIAPFVAGVTLLALLNPKLGKFNVTEKGENADRARFDFRYGGGTLALLLLSVIGLGIAFPLRLLWYCAHPGDPSQLDSIVLNSLWALANLILLVATACAALEQPQQRRAPRLKRRYCCELITDEESDPISCETVDISESGVRVRLDALVPLPAYCRLVLKSGTAFVNLQAERVTYDWAQRRTGRSFAVADFSLSAQNVQASFKFNGLDPLAHRQLIELLFTADGCWNEQEYDEDRLLTSFWHLLTTFWRATRSRRANLSPAPTLKGTWPAWVGETPCTCTAISGAHAIVARSNSSSVKSEGSGKLGSAFTIEVTPGRKLTVPLGVSSASAGQQRLDFVWNSSNQERDFWQALYGKLADEPPARFSMVQRLLADLR